MAYLNNDGLDLLIKNLNDHINTKLSKYVPVGEEVPIASRLGSETVGSQNQPIYLESGSPAACSKMYTVDEIDTKVIDLNTAISGKAPASHTHDDLYYTESEINTKISDLNTAIGGKANISHSHNDLYYTESEIDTKITDLNTAIGGKAPKSHSSNTTDYGAGTSSNYGHVKLVTGDMNGATHTDGVAVSKDHTHGQYSTTGHTHDDRYYTESEINTKVTDLNTAINGKAPIASPTFTGTPSAPTANKGTNTTQIATTAYVKTEIDSVLAASDAMMFKGTLGTGGTITSLPASHSVGDTYKIITAGTYAGNVCNVGDLIICITNGTSANNAHWTVVESNNDGIVTGPASSVNERVAVFSGTSGKVIKDSGYTIAKSVPADAKFTDTVYTHPIDAGYKHIPSGGATGNILLYGGSSGTASWSTLANAGIATTGQITDLNTALSGKAPTSHASTATTYGAGTTSNYGHVKLATGDMNGATHVDGVAVSKDHTHGQYSTTGHTHDDRHYTESEINTKVTDLNTAISGKVSKSGDTMTGDLTFDCSNDSDRFITFDSMDSPNAFTWRMGHLASGSNDANYLVFQSSHGTTTSSAKWTNALRLGLQTFDATFSGNILPATNLSKNLGSNTASFNRTYTRYIDTADTYYLRLCTSGKELMTLNCDSDTISASAHILPTVTNSYDLGSTSARWNNIHTRTLHGSICGPVPSNINKNHTLTYIGGQFEVTSTPTSDKIYAGSSSDHNVVSVAKLDGSSTVANVMNLRVHFNTKYYHDIAMYPNDGNNVYHRGVSNGVARDWQKFVLSDMDNNITGTISNVKISQSSNSSNFPLTFVSTNAPGSSSMFVGASNNLTINPSTGEAKSKSFTAETKVTVGSSFMEYNSTTGCLEITA